MLNLLVNLNSGKNPRKTKKIVDKLASFLSEKKVNYKVFYSAYRGHISEMLISLEAQGETQFVLVGGDGTFNEAINTNMNFENVCFGLVSSGTKNNIARTFNISTKPLEAMATILENNAVKVNALKVGDRKALASLSSGIEVKLLSNLTRLKKINSLTYFWTLLKTCKEVRAEKYQVNANGTEVNKTDLLGVYASNGSWPGIKRDKHETVEFKNKINFLELHKINKIRLPFILNKLYKGKPISRKLCEELGVNSVAVNTDRKTLINFDGELYRDLVYDVKLIKNALQVYLPIEKNSNKNNIVNEKIAKTVAENLDAKTDKKTSKKSQKTDK